MTAETTQPTPEADPQTPETPSKPGLAACIGAGVGVFLLFVLISIVPWLEFVKGFTNLAWMNPVLMLGAAVGSLIMFLCVANKPVEQLGKHGKIIEMGARILALACVFWILGSLVALIGSGGNLPSKSRYPELMNLAPDQITSDKRDGNMALGLVREGAYDMWVRKSECDKLVSWSGNDMKYELLVNDKPLGVGQCKRGLNTLEWMFKG